MAPNPTPEEMAAAAEQLRNAPAPEMAPPDEATVAAELAAKQSASTAGVTEVDPGKLMALIQALQARVDGLEEEKRAGNAPPVVGLSETVRDSLAVHANHNPGTDFSEVRGLADDLVDAAGNAAESGDGTELGKIGARLERALRKVHPGPGDHHYFSQALGFIRDHLPEAIDGLEPRRTAAPAAAIGSDRAPAKVVPGSVTG